MSLSSKQIREIQSLYESVYAPKDEKVNLVLTNEEFEELCTCILVETFNSVVLDEVTKKIAKDAVTNPGIRDTAVKVLTKIFKPETIKGGITRGAGSALAVDAAAGGKSSKRVGAVMNPRNLYQYVKGMFAAADTPGFVGGGPTLKHKKSGDFYTIKQAKDSLNNSFEFDDFNLYICEGAPTKEDLVNQLNKEKNKSKTDKENTNVKGEGTSGNGAQGASNGAQGGTSGAQGGTNGTQSKTNGTQGKTNGAQGTPTGEKPTGGTPTGETPTGGTPTGGTPTGGTPTGGTPTGAQGAQGAQGTKTTTPYTPNFKDVDKYTSKNDIPTMKDFQSSDKNEIKKDKPKFYSTPLKDKTDLGSAIKPIKAGGATDLMRAKNEIIHGSDHVGKLVNQQADFTAMKRGEITKQQFADKYPNSQTAKKLKKSKLPPSVMDYESYQPYDLVLDYIITEGHADTVEEAHYVMTQMDAETIQTIINEYEIV